MKVTIVGGAGGVGASAAFNLLVSSDVRDRPRGLASDRDHLAPDGLRAGSRALPRLERPQRYRGGRSATQADSRRDGCRAARRSTRRGSSISRTTRGSSTTSSTSCRPNWPGVILVVTNPVDPLVTRIQRRDRPRSTARRRLHGQRQPALQHGAREGPRSPAGQRAGMGARRARRGARRAPRPYDGRRRARAAHRASRPRRPRSSCAPGTSATSPSTPGRSSTWTSGLGVSRMVSALVHGRRRDVARLGRAGRRVRDQRASP